MKIGIDGRMIGEKMHGIARYTVNLLKGILNIDKTNQYILLITEKYPYKDDILFDNLSYMCMKSQFISLSEPFELYTVLKRERFDIFHSPSFIPPFYRKGPFLMTIHDMSHLVYSGLSRRLYYKFIIKPYVKKARRILTVSEFSKSEICSAFSLEEEKVSVIYNGVEDRFGLISEKVHIQKVKERHNIPGKFILTIGNEKDHKNLKTLLKAFKKVDRDYFLVLNLEGKGLIEREVRGAGIKERVYFIGYVDDSDMPCLYNAASAFVLVSLKEGFGLPALEAMACGCPVVVSDTSSLPEVCGDAAFYVDPGDVDDIAKGINEVLGDLELRDNLIQKGLKRASLFTWEKASKEVLNLYMELTKYC